MVCRDEVSCFITHALFGLSVTDEYGGLSWSLAQRTTETVLLYKRFGIRRAEVEQKEPACVDGILSSAPLHRTEPGATE